MTDPLASRSPAYLIRLAEAASITGLPLSLLRKSFMREEKRPRNVPPPPPHRRIGRAIYVLADRLPEWVEGLANPDVELNETSRQGHAGERIRQGRGRVQKRG